jgi:hypothetical protein
MKKRTRFFFIALGFTIFFILAPLIIIYTSGTLFDFRQKQTVSTGILSVQTKPDDAEVYLNGKSETTTPTSIRFLQPGEYEVGIKKDGYFPWQKRLEIKSGKVSWVSEKLPELHLVKQDTNPTIITSGVIDAAYHNDFIIALIGDTIELFSKNEKTISVIIKLPAVGQRIVTGSHNQFVIVTSAAGPIVVDLEAKSATLVAAFLETTILGILDTQTILAQSSGDLFLYDLLNKKKIPLLSQVSSATISGNTIYAIQKEGISLVLRARQLNGYELDLGQIIAAPLPEFTNAELIVTNQKHIFVVDSKILYRINETLEPILYDVLSWRYDEHRQSLLFKTSSELYYYDPIDSKSVLITRFNEPIHDPILEPSIGYIFFTQGTETVALELDNRDRQNRYGLYQTSNPSGLTMSNDGKRLYILDNAILKEITIR